MDQEPLYKTANPALPAATQFAAATATEATKLGHNFDQIQQDVAHQVAQDAMN